MAKAATDTLLKSGCVNPPCYDSILFEQLTSDLIRWPALHTHGAAGPSGVDAYAWRLCSSLGYASMALCNTLATAVLISTDLECHHCYQVHKGSGNPIMHAMTKHHSWYHLKEAYKSNIFRFRFRLRLNGGMKMVLNTLPFSDITIM